MEVYHYMPLEALHSMLCAYMGSQCSNNKLTFWASSALHMNDTKEIIESFNVIGDFVTLVEKYIKDLLYKELSKKQKIEEDEFGRYLNLTDYVKQMDFTAQKKDLLGMNLLQYFVISLSKARDSLPMWNTYGNEGGGVCLKFETEDLQPNVKDYADLSLIISNVIYKPEQILEDEQKSIFERLVDVYKRYLEDFIFITENDNREVSRYHLDKKIKPQLILNNIPNADRFVDFICKEIPGMSINEDATTNLIKDKAINDLKRRTINEMILNLCPFIKHPGFSYEEECRALFQIAIGRDNNFNPTIPNIIKYRMNRKGNIIPYVEIEIPINNIKEIIVGPCADYDMVENTLNLEMLSCGINKIPISSSKLPYRHY